MVDINRLRVNFQIRIPQVRVMQNGEQLGIMPTEKARNLAYDQGLDLVEMVPNANPPVCHILDYSKYKYEQKVKHKDHMKKQREMVQAVKEIRLSPAIGQHDLDIKIKHIIEFLKRFCYHHHHFFNLKSVKIFNKNVYTLICLTFASSVT